MGLLTPKAHIGILKSWTKYGYVKNWNTFPGLDPVSKDAGTYKRPLPTYNINEVITQGDQYMYVKPSVLSEQGCFVKK